MERLRRFLRRITGISTPIGGISWNQSESKANEVPTFDEQIYVTDSGNETFIAFLDANDGRIVFLKANLDASVATQKQFEVVEEEGLDLDRISSGRFSGIPLPLPNEENKLVSVVFHFSDRHVLTYSAGGTGVVTVGVTGFFEVSRTFHGGPSTAFHLKEIDAPLEFRLDLLNMRWSHRHSRRIAGCAATGWRC